MIFWLKIYLRLMKFELGSEENNQTKLKFFFFLKKRVNLARSCQRAYLVIVPDMILVDLATEK